MASTSNITKSFTAFPRKNRALRFSAAVLVFTIVTLCMLSGTLAKYTTSSNDQASARVAKWGVEVEVPAGTLFSNKYTANHDPYNTSMYTVEAEGDNADELLVAPGTSNETNPYIFSITGAPEVAVRVSIDTIGSDSDNWYTIDEEYYFPIVFTLTHNGRTVSHGPDNSTQMDFDELISVLEGLSGEYEPNANLSDIYGEYEISWKWDFNENTDDDNYLGNAELRDEDLASVDFRVEITVEQID